MQGYDVEVSQLFPGGFHANYHISAEEAIREIEKHLALSEKPYTDKEGAIIFQVNHEGIPEAITLKPINEKAKQLFIKAISAKSLSRKAEEPS